jgi:hypothetical protein
MGLSDDPMPTPMRGHIAAAVNQEDASREMQGYHLRAVNGFVYVLAIMVGAFIGAALGKGFVPQMQAVLAVFGALALPSLLYWAALRRAKRYERLDTEARYKRQEEQALLRDKQIEEARAGGDFDRWQK